ncbi:golgin subfamily A member 6-like protein 22 [Xenia sp. Carnegie-2017]|uniref:golgin subfamily A member 6-like protein 22 n=1 Tax=Xenia sp. Carnegie-2017 TaxID=2897299 RepID=UPI001F04142E|nr:golgin subfamily A member 6-like protein 22 [Xenia sp. Carnegie-2017]
MQIFGRATGHGEKKHEDIHNENFKMLLNQEQEEEQDKDIPQEERCRNCGLFLLRAKELERELAALRKLEEDNVLLVSKNEKLVEQIEDEKLKLDMLTNGNLPDSESKMKLEEFYSEKSPSKLKENSKKYLKKRVFQLENDCKDLWRKLQNEVVKNKNKEQEIIEKEELLTELQKTRVSTTKEKDFSCFNESSNTSVKDRNIERKPESTNMEKDDESCAVKEKLNKAEKRIRLLQDEIDRFHESYSNNLRKELENTENKWTQRLRQECDTIQSEMSEEFRKQKEEWHEKESELHSLIEELQIQIEEIEIERKQLENEIKIWKTSNEHEKLPNEESVTANFDRSSDIIIENNNIYRTPETTDQEYITDRDLRRLANKLKKDQWFRLAKLLSISDCEIQEIDKLKIGKDEKAFRALSEWRTSAEEISGNQVSQLTFALEEIHRKDLVQFILNHRDMCKLRRKSIRI